MSWYNFNKNEPVGTSIIEDIHTCFYCRDLDWRCFDEHHSSKDAPFQTIIDFVENGYLDKNSCDKSRVFIHCSNGETYELKVEKLKDKKQGCFYKENNMKHVKLICPKCGYVFSFKNYWHWVLRSPMHWFGKRYTKCIYCGKRGWMKREK